MSSCYWFYSGYVTDVIFLPIYNNLSPKICCDNHSKVKKFEDLTTCHLKFIVILFCLFCYPLFFSILVWNLGVGYMFWVVYTLIIYYIQLNKITLFNT